MTDDSGSDGIDIGIIIAVFGSLFQTHLADIFISFKVGIQCFPQCRNVDEMFFVDQRIDSSNAVCRIANSYGESRNFKVFGTAVLQGLAFFNAVIDDERRKGRRHPGRLKGADNIEAFDYHFGKIVNLGIHGLLQFFQCIQFFQFACLRPHLFTIYRIDTIMHDQFKYLQHVQVPGGRTSIIFPGNTRLYTAMDTPIPCFLNGTAAFLLQHRHDEIIVEKCRRRHASLDHADSFAHQFRTERIMPLNGHRGLRRLDSLISF